MDHRRCRALRALVPLLVFFSSTARATYSIVAADQATHQVGGAVTSCVNAQGVTIVYGPAPGFGGINAQAAANTKGRDRGIQLLQSGTGPTDIIQQITASSFDPSATTRQYGVVDLQGRAAGFTGTGTSDFADHRTGNVGTFTYAIQGNILTSEDVLTQAEAGFRAQGCDLAERLMIALEEGAKNGEGDSRCTQLNPSIPADASSIEVDRSGEPAGSYLKLAFASPSTSQRQNAVVRLRTLFNTWRQTHPCPGPQDAGVDADSGSSDASRDTFQDWDATSADTSGDRSVDVASDVPNFDGSDSSEGSIDGAADGSAGAGGAGGTAGNAGKGGTGGSTDAGNTGGAGGTTTGGNSGSGGTAGGSAGATGSGGTGAAGSGGTSGTSGAAGSNRGGGGGATSGTTGSGSRNSDDGCSCRVDGTSTRATSLGWEISLFTALAAMMGRRRTQRSSSFGGSRNERAAASGGVPRAPEG